MNKLLTSLAAGALFLLIFSGTASAAPSYFGTSGMMLVPDSRTVGKYSFGSSAHYMDLNDDFAGTSLGGGTQIYGLSYGVADALEVGFSQIRDSGATHGVFNGKFRILEQGGAAPVGLTVGAIDLLDSHDFSGYAVGSLRLDLIDAPEKVPVNLNLHAGYGSGMFGEGLMAGAELSLNPRFSVLVEGSPGTINSGLRVQAQDLVLDVGLLDMQHLSFGIGYGMSMPGMGIPE